MRSVFTKGAGIWALHSRQEFALCRLGEGQVRGPREIHSANSDVSKQGVDVGMPLQGSQGLNGREKCLDICPTTTVLQLLQKVEILQGHGDLEVRSYTRKWVTAAQECCRDHSLSLDLR